MHLYSEHIQPTVVTHSSSFGKDGELLAIIRGSSLLQIYEEGFVLLAEFPLEGQVLHLSSIAGDNSLRLALVIRAAKVIILEWNYETRSFDTLSIHYYEKELMTPFGSSEYPTKLAMDHRCICYLFQKDQLALLPIQDNVDFELEHGLVEPIDTSKKSPFCGRSFLINSKDLGAGCSNIVDIAFLEGYLEPTLGVLYQSKRTWAGLNPTENENDDEDSKTGGIATTQFAMFTLNLVKQDATLIAVVPDLEYYNAKLQPLPTPVGGCIVLGRDSLLYVDSRGQVLHPSPEISSLFNDSDETELAELDLAHTAQLASLPVRSQPPSVFLATSDRRIFRIAFDVEGFKILTLGIQEITDVQGVPNPTCIAATKWGDLIIGSQGSNAKVYECVYSESQVRTENGVSHDESGDSLAAIQAMYDDMLAKETIKLVVNLEESFELPSLGPISTVCETGHGHGIAMAIGEGSDSQIAFAKEEVDFHTLLKIPNLINYDTNEERIWCIPGYLIVTRGGATDFYLGPNYQRRKAPSSAVDVREPTLAVGVCGDVVVHVQPKSLSTYTVKGWRRKNSIKFNNEAVYAEIRGDRIVILSMTETKVYDIKLAELPIPAGLNGNLCSLGTEAICSTAGDMEIAYHRFGETDRILTYDLTGLAEVVHPTGDTEIGKSDDSQDNGAAIEAVYLLELGTVQRFQRYVGILVNRELVLYHMYNGRLIKTYTVPLTVSIEPQPVQIEGYKALVIRGHKSHILMKDSRHAIRCFPINHSGDRIVDILDIDNEIIYTDTNGTVRFANIDIDNVDYTSCDLVIRRFPIGEQIKEICWYQKLRTLVIGVVNGIRLLSTSQLNNEGRNSVSSVTLGDDEQTIVLQCLNLETGRDVVVLGSAEGIVDAETSGHVRIYQVSGTESAARLKQIAHLHLSGAVTGVCESMGRLVVSHGQQIHVYVFQITRELEPVAFYDTQVFTQNLKTVRNLLAMGDAVCGTSLINYCIEPNRLELLSRDSDGPTATESKVTNIEYVSSGSRGDLQIVVSDLSGRLRLLQFDPETPASKGGAILLPRASIFIGRSVNSMTVKECGSDAPQAFGFDQVDRDLVALGGTMDGVLFSVAPIEESVYRVLFVVTQQMMDKEPPLGCLNHRAHRAYLGGQSPGPIIDFRYAQGFWNLPSNKQELYSRRLGEWGLEETQRVLHGISNRALR